LTVPACRSAPPAPHAPVAGTRLGAVETRDRLANLGILGAAVVAWGVVALLVLNRDPRQDPAAGVLGAVAMGTAACLTAMPLYWLAVFARHRRIAYHGDWLRAARRGLWTGLVTGLLVELRVLGVFSVPIALFILVLVVFAELTLSIER
jgi:hypothetical protein